MEVELVTNETSDGENYGFDDTSEDYLNIEGERCGICMDVVIDRGVLDCCQHWFCFACIDNWATITSLCPLCQNEFQLITCVPVYDTVGGNKTDDDTNLRDDDWFIEGKCNTLSFPSYYIDENAVVCLDGDGCKIRSGSVAIEEDSDIDTSIACDSCDKWYHAFCVGFDPEGSCDSSWLCPRCTLDKGPNTSFSGRVSVSVADDGETAVVISLLEANQESQELSQLAGGCSKDMGNTLLSSLPKLEALPGDRESVEPKSRQQGIELTLSRHNHCSSSHAILPAELNTNADGAVKRAQRHLDKKMIDSGLDLDRAISMGSGTPDMKDNDISEDKLPGSSEPDYRSEDNIQVVSAEKMLPNEILENMMPDEKLTTSGITGAKRKHRDSRNAENGGREANIETRPSRKKMKAGKNSQPISLTNQTASSVPDDSSTIFRQNSSREKESGTPDIMDIVQGTDHRFLKQPGRKISSDITPKERDGAAGLRLKKIMRRPGDDKDSSVLVQELRKKIRAAVRNKSSEELGQNLFDSKLLDAFRATLAGSGAENRKPTLDVRAKRSLLQKGKIRESLTKKIYGAGGKRKRAWTRECEVEFWKHRCLKTSKPEKIQTLKSVLDVLRDDNSDHSKKMPGNEEGTKGSILSRVYLADTSVFPRKNDIKPVSVSDLDSVATPEQNRESSWTEKVSIPMPANQPDKNSSEHNSLLSQLKVTPSDGKETKKSVKGVKSETASKGAPNLAVGGKKVPSEKDKASKSDMVKGDKRQWALEVLARRTAASAKNMQEKEEDSAILKGNFTLLAQLPKEMRPVLAPSCQNKIPASVRQTQLYRLTEHLLKKTNVSVVCRTAETELAVADAVNIEKQVADRSNSKLVYLNLCSQELLRRSDDMNFARPKEENNPCLTSEWPSDGTVEETNNNNSSLDLGVEEALKRAGLMSDSPPTSPNHPTKDINNNNNQVGSPENSDDEGPENVIEADSHSEIDIYGDFEYNLEDDDFIGAGALNNTCKPQPEPPKLKMLFSSLKPEKPDGIVGPFDHEEALTNSLDPLASQNWTGTGGPSVDGRKDGCLVRNSEVGNDEDLSLAECEELYGPDKEPLIEKYPVFVSVKPFEQMVNNKLTGENGDNGMRKKSGQPSKDCVDKFEAGTDGSKLSSSGLKKREDVVEKEKTTKSDPKQSEHSCTIMKKVEAYIKEHIRPLCKSRVITVEQYRWAVGRTTEKVMKYHSKEKNANFLIKEGEKVKKLAEQYVEASQQKAKT